MRKILLLLMLFASTTLTNCSAKDKNGDKTTTTNPFNQNKKDNSVKFININYLNKVEGLNVSVAFVPKFSHVSGKVSGVAIMEFSNEDSSFILINNHYAISNKLIEYTSGEYGIINFFTQKDITLEYNHPKIANNFRLENIKVPFLFYDINFDGNKELMIPEYATGQRSVNEYKVYLLENGKLGEELKEKPYDELDGFSTINRINNEIEIYYSGGWCAGLYYSYKLHNNGKLKIYKIVEEQRAEPESDSDTFNCYKLIYKVNRGEKKLIETIKVE